VPIYGKTTADPHPIPRTSADAASASLGAVAAAGVGAAVVGAAPDIRRAQLLLARSIDGGGGGGALPSNSSGMGRGAKLQALAGVGGLNGVYGARQGPPAALFALAAAPSALGLALGARLLLIRVRQKRVSRGH
jgi:hypothetical protein